MRNDLYPYPVETLKHWYVTVVGGQSFDLKPNQIGVNKDALAENTDIVPYEDSVLISKLEGRGAPIVTKKYFTVVPLGTASPDASSKSPNGEVVLPVLDIKERTWCAFEVGDQVILNNVLSQRNLCGFANALDRLLKKKSGNHSIIYEYNS